MENKPAINKSIETLSRRLIGGKMEINKKFSIITVCFNSEKTISDTIKSILNQNYKNIEYIIVDGKSQDKTIEIIESYKEDFINKGIALKIISEKDNGIYDAMNKGINIATGEIIGIINSDDWYEKDILNDVAKIFEKNNVDIVYGDLDWIFEIDGQIYYKRQPSCNDFSEVKKGMLINHPTVFVKKEIYKSVGLFNEKYKIAADWDFILRVMKYGVSSYYYNKNMAYFRFNGISTLPSFKHVLEKLDVRLNNNIRLNEIITSFIKDVIGYCVMFVSRNILPKKMYLIIKKKRFVENWEKVK